MGTAMLRYCRIVIEWMAIALWPLVAFSSYYLISMTLPISGMQVRDYLDRLPLYCVIALVFAMQTLIASCRLLFSQQSSNHNINHIVRLTSIVNAAISFVLIMVLILWPSLVDGLEVYLGLGVLLPVSHSFVILATSLLNHPVQVCHVANDSEPLGGPSPSGIQIGHHHRPVEIRQPPDRRSADGDRSAPPDDSALQNF
jgi:hypothetical protein